MGAILITMARSGVVDSAALHCGLSEGWIATAGLDVTDPEPLPPDNPLQALDTCLIVPRSGSATHATRCRMAELPVDNVVAGLEGRRLPRCANPAV